MKFPKHIVDHRGSVSRRWTSSGSLLAVSALMAACGGGGDTPTATSAGAPEVDALGRPSSQAADSIQIAAATTASAPATALSSGWSRIAGEGESFVVQENQTVRYGAGTSWVVKVLSSAGQCTNGFFGSDPIFGTLKSCEVATSAAAPAPAPAPGSGWSKIAVEGESFVIQGSQAVRYGAGTSWVVKVVAAGGQCTNGFFGSDPAYGTVKSCEVGAPAPAPAPAPSPAPAPAPSPAPAPAPAPAPTVSTRDAVRLADQATFGATESLVAAIKAQGTAGWIAAQMGLNSSRYTSGNGSEVHQYTGGGNFCDGRGDNCWRDWSSTEPLVWDFYRNATTRPDQLRQRVAFALQQIVVVSNLEVDGTYGFRLYHNNLLDNAFGNYRQVLKKVALSPLMGDYLDNANNDKAAPNENFARELLQLFSVGTCALNLDGSLQNGTCTATYSNETVRSYAFALTGWTYPAGGKTPWGCWPTGMNCRYYDGDMVPVASYHDTAERKLLAGLTVAAGTAAAPALETVLDSLMAHPNIGPFIGKQLIQHLVGSNPSPAYVARVATAFNSGKYGSTGTGVKGDLAATVTAVLLDAEARGDTVGRQAGKLREPALMFTGVLRGLNGTSDGDALAWWWGDILRQHVFRPPSVFNFYPPDYPVAGTTLLGPQFGIHSANAALERLNFLTYLLDWGGSAPNTSVPNAIGTRIDLSAFTAGATDAATLVDRLSLLATGKVLAPTPRQKVIDAVAWWTDKTDPTNWRLNRVKAAAYLVYGAPDYQVQR